MIPRHVIRNAVENPEQETVAMDMRVVMAIVLLGIVILAGIVSWAYRRRRTERLRSRFGGEYDRAVHAGANRAGGEAELEARMRRVKTLHIHDLAPKDRDRLVQAWKSVQGQFADDPQGAVAAADELVSEAMQGRGYPVGDVAQSVADISVLHAPVVEDYRRAREISLRADRGEASTEDLRQAMIGYRTLFGDLIGAHSGRREVRDDWAA